MAEQMIDSMFEQEHCHELEHILAVEACTSVEGVAHVGIVEEQEGTTALFLS